MRTGVGSEDRATALPLVADDTTLKPSVQSSHVDRICGIRIPSLSLVGDGFLVCGVDDLEAKLSSKPAPSKLCVLGKHGPLEAGAKPSRPQLLEHFRHDQLSHSAPHINPTLRSPESKFIKKYMTVYAAKP